MAVREFDPKSRRVQRRRDASVAVTCPHCGEEEWLSPNVIGQRAQCNHCRTIFVIRASSSVAEPNANDDASLTQREKRILIAGIAASIILGLALALYLFVLRDTWERDHQFELVAMHETARSAALRKDVSGAHLNYQNLFKLIGGHTITDVALKMRLDTARREFVPIDAEFRQMEIVRQDKLRSQQLRNEQAEEARTRVVNNQSGVRTDLSQYDNGYAWQQADYATRIALCQRFVPMFNKPGLQRHDRDARWYYQLIEAFYNSTRPEILRQQINQPVVLGVAVDETQ